MILCGRHASALKNRNLWGGLILAFALIPRISASSSAAVAPPVAAGKKAVATHGRLEVSAFYLEATDDLLRLVNMPDQQPVWRFPGNDPEVALGALISAGLDAEAAAALASSGAISLDGGKVSILPGIDLLVSLSSVVRQSIYSLLAANGLNPHYAKPQLILGDFEEWMRGSSLSARQRELLRALLWRQRGVLAFSDVSALMAVAGTAAELEEARRVMTRVRTLHVRVVPPSGEGVAGFLEYWTAGGLNRASGPLINAVLEESSGAGIDLALLLPPLARERLYTYPSLQDGVGGRLPDCHWTSLNFFSVRPQPYYLDARTSYLSLTQSYLEIPKAERFGDVLAFVSSDGLVLHTCVHVAEDIVFSKNGQLLLAPWLLQRLPDVAAVYGGPDREVHAFRLRTAPD